MQLTLIPVTTLLDHSSDLRERGRWQGRVSIIRDRGTELLSIDVPEALCSTEAEARSEAESQIQHWTQSNLGLRRLAAALISTAQMTRKPEHLHLVAEILNEAGVSDGWMANLPQLGLELTDVDPDDPESELQLHRDVIAIRETFRRMIEYPKG